MSAWSKRYKACTRCGGKDRRHAGHGLCMTCYQREWEIRNSDHRVAYRRMWRAGQVGEDREKRMKAAASRYGIVAADILREDKCNMCGRSEAEHGVQITIHHRDHLGSNMPVLMQNNSRENLEGLCAECHGRLHGTKYEWSKKWPACIECGTNERKHQAGGRCTACYRRRWRKDRK